MQSSFRTIIIFLILSIIGIFLVPKLSVRLNPKNSNTNITVSYSWHNANSFTIERGVTNTLETAFSTIKGIQKISSKSSKGYGYITLEVDKYTNTDALRFEIASVIRRIYKKLPKNVSYPTIQLNKPDEEETPFLTYAITAPIIPHQIQEIVKTQIVPQLSSIKGINSSVYGANPLEYVITYSMDYLLQLNISKKDILNALKEHFTSKNLGMVYDNQSYISINVYQDIKDIATIPIKKIGNRIVYLYDVATVKKQEQEANRYYRINGESSIYISLTANRNTNTIVLSKQIEKKIKEIQNTLPKKISILKTYDDTVFVKKELKKIYKRSLYTILILLFFISLVSRSLSYLILTILSLVANVSIAFILFWLFKVEIQLYSLAGITISLGLLLDNSIVMIDHIKKSGNKKVFIPILASTLTTIGALAIIYFLDDKLKLNLIDFALVIVINLGVSLFIALFLIPALLDKINIKQHKKEKKDTIWYIWYKDFIAMLLQYKKISIIFIVLLFGLPLFMLPQHLDENKTWYQKVYNNTLGNTWYLENVRPVLDKYTGGSLRLFNYYVFEQAQYNRNKQTKLYVSASMEKGATVHQMNEVFLQIENYLKPFTEIERFTTNVYSGDYANIEIAFKPKYENTSFPYVLKSRLIRKALDLGGLHWSIYGVGNGFNNGNGGGLPVNFSIQASGYNYNELNKWADTLKQKLLKHPRIQKVDIRDNSRWKRKQSYRYVITLNTQKLALFNNTPRSLYNNLKDYTLSKYPELNLMINEHYFPIRLQSEESKNFDFWHVKNNFLNKKNPVKLNNIAKIKKEKEEENIFKENQEYLRKIEFQYTGSTKFGSKYLNKVLKEVKQQLPLGYKFKRQENNWFFSDDTQNNYLVLIGFIFLIIYFITAILFENLKQPFVILSVIPISFIGVFLTFYLFDYNFDQGGMASFVLLSGITVNATIYIVNQYNELKKQNSMTDLDAYILAFKHKFFPIILTILSTIFGFIPFVVNGQKEIFWFALAVGTIGGLLFSLVAIIFYLPILLLNLKSASTFVAKS